MLTFLRLIGLLNAALWFGASLFFTVSVGPAFFSEEMLRFLPLPYAGAAAQVLIKRYFILQNGCLLIAMAHLIAEWLYAGRPLPRLMLCGLGALLAMTLLVGIWVQPHLKRLHYIKYSGRYAAVEIQRASASFRRWHAFTWIGNCLLLAGAAGHFYLLARAQDGTRFASVTKFRS